MRILFVNSIQMFGGGEVWLFRAMRALSERGHHVFLLCRKNTILEKRARGSGFRVFTLTLRGDFDPVAILRIWRLLRHLRIGVICTNMDKELRLAGIAGKLAGVRGIVPRRGIDYPLKNTWAYRITYQKLASGVIANSNATKASLLKYATWLDPEKIRVIYNGIDPAPFAGRPHSIFRQEFNLSNDNFVIGFVGQLDERKGVMTLLKAFLMVAECHPKARLLLVGDGPLESALRKVAIPFSDRVVLAGYREDIVEVMQSIDVLVLPSLWEGFGIVLIEAMASGKPVITTNVSNMPEIVTHGRDGFLVPIHDSDAIFGCVHDLIMHPDLAKEMGRQGSRTVEKRFTIRRMIDELESYFRQLSRENCRDSKDMSGE